MALWGRYVMLTTLDVSTSSDVAHPTRSGCSLCALHGIRFTMVSARAPPQSTSTWTRVNARASARTRSVLRRDVNITFHTNKGVGSHSMRIGQVHCSRGKLTHNSWVTIDGADDDQHRACRDLS